MNILFAVLIFLFPLQTHHGLNFTGSIVWNTGYSNFITFMDIDGCTHIDPGGTLTFPIQAIYNICAHQNNSWHFLHKDRFHSNYTRYLQKLKKLLDFTKSQNSVNLDSIVKETFDLSYIKKNKILSLGHLDKKQLECVFKTNTLNFKTDYLIMPNHGQHQYLNQDLIQYFKSYKMRISGSESKIYGNHKTTKIKFDKIKAPIVYKNIWGHLYFQ